MMMMVVLEGFRKINTVAREQDKLRHPVCLIREEGGRWFLAPGGPPVLARVRRGSGDAG